MALKVIFAKKTLIVNLALTAIGQMLSSFVRRKKVKVNFVGQIASVQGIAMTWSVGMEVEETDAEGTAIANLEGVSVVVGSASERDAPKEFATSWCKLIL